MTRKTIYILDYKGGDVQIGGTSNYLKLLAPRVMQAGFDVRVAMPFSPRTDNLLADLRTAAVPVDNLDTSPTSGSVFHRFYTAYRYFLTQRPYLVHFMMPWWNACEYGILASWFARVPVRVTTHHAIPEDIDPRVYAGLSGFTRRQRHRLTSKCVDKAIAVCAENGRRLVENDLYSADQVVAVRNGVEIKRFSSVDGGVDYRRRWGVASSDVLITVVGYLEDIKGHRYLLQALPSIVQRHSNVMVAFVGDGVLKTSLQTQVLETGLSDHVIFPGWQEDVPSILASSDLLVLPSLSEGLPLVVLEAMSAGLPVVATRVGGIPEAVIEERTGLLADPASAQGLEEAIIRLLQDPERMRSMGAAGRSRAREKFDVHRMVAETCDIYRMFM